MTKFLPERYNGKKMVFEIDFLKDGIKGKEEPTVGYPDRRVTKVNVKARKVCVAALIADLLHTFARGQLFHRDSERVTNLVKGSKIGKLVQSHMLK